MTDSQHPVFPWLTPERRGWIYRVSAAAAPLLILAGIVSDVAAPLWLGLLVAVLSTGTAAAHTPTEASDG